MGKGSQGRAPRFWRPNQIYLGPAARRAPIAKRRARTGSHCGQTKPVRVLFLVPLAYFIVEVAVCPAKPAAVVGAQPPWGPLVAPVPVVVLPGLPEELVEERDFPILVSLHKAVRPNRGDEPKG